MGFNFTATGLITIIIGLIACFFGFRAKKVVILLIWFLIGFSVGQKIMPNFTAFFIFHPPFEHFPHFWCGDSLVY